MIDIEQICKEIIRGEPAVKFPLKLAHGTWISDANGGHVIDIRGWGKLQYHEQGVDYAANIQDSFAIWVVETLNNEAIRRGLL